MSEEKELHPVITLLLARMDSNPEEFVDEYESRWRFVFEYEMNSFSEAEKEILGEGRRKIMKDRLHEQVMRELLDPAQKKAEVSIIDKYLAGTANSSAQTKAEMHQKIMQQGITHKYGAATVSPSPKSSNALATAIKEMAELYK